MKLVRGACLVVAMGLACAACNPKGSCVYKEVDVCTTTTKRGCAAAPGEFRQDKTCQQLGYTYREQTGHFAKPPAR